MKKKRLLSAVVLGLVVAGGLARAAAPPAVYSLTEEDDGIFTGQDRHYTQGILLTRTAEPQSGGFWATLAGDFGSVATVLGAGPAVEQRYQFPIVGQSLFTPMDILIPVPDPHDRPYAGWLYLGAGLLRRSNSGRIDHFQLLLGVVGPAALGRQVQNGFHALVGYGKAAGWSHQLHNEPGLLAAYQTIWDQRLPQVGPVEADVLPQLGITAGNVLTYGEVGLTVRLGQSLSAAGTPQTVTPGLSGSGWFDPSKLDRPVGWMAYAGLQTRAIWRNLFLEGNSYQSSPGVEKRNFVTDEDVGVSLLFRFGLRMDVTYIKRSREFSGQVNDDRIGSVTLSAPF